MAKHSKKFRIHQDEGTMFRKNMYITKAQDRILKQVREKYGKLESQQLREALCMYFEALGFKL